MPRILFALLLLAPLSALAGPADADGARVDPELLKTLDARGSARMLVYLREQADLRGAKSRDWLARGRYVHRQLVEAAERSQAPLRAYLDQAGIAYRAFWIANAVVVEAVDLETLNAVQTMPGIRSIKSDSGSRLMVPEVVDSVNVSARSRRAGRSSFPRLRGKDRMGAYLAAAPTLTLPRARGRESHLHAVEGKPAVASNIAYIGAPAVWDMGYTGKGITVGIIDSGARYTHEALVTQYRGHQGDGKFSHDHNWYDPEQQSGEPRFPHPHGTHVTGTAVGGAEAQGIGVAPGAEWIACLGCPGNQCPDAALLACAQFMAAPTTTDGQNANPDLRPHVINNSWGDCETAYNDWFQEAVDHWIELGIVPVFSAGNAQACNYPRPPGLNTVGNPARYGTVLGVGSTGDSDGEYATHSNWGPTDDASPGGPEYPEHHGFPQIKPNIVAPGVNIFSSVNSSDSAYQSGWTGTSMSAPHVTGLVALMWSAAPCLIGDYAQTGTLIMQSARPIDLESGGEPPPGPGNHPNHATGWGEIDAAAAVEAAIERCTPGFDLGAEPVRLDLCAGKETSFEVVVVPRIDFNDPVTLAVSGLPPEAQAVFAENPIEPAEPAFHTDLVFSNTGDIPAGRYALEITGESSGPGFDPAADLAQAALDVVTQVPTVITELAPGFGAGRQPLQPGFTWRAQAGAAAYRIQLADNRDFNDPIVDETVTETALTLPAELEPATLYFWRVAAVNACGEGEFSRTSRFATRPVHGECSLGTDVVTLFHEDFADGELPAGWSTDGSSGEATWTVSGTRSYQGSYSAFAGNIESVSDQHLIAPPVPLPAHAGTVLLNFENWQSIEAGGAGCFDGAIVEVSEDGGANWSQPDADDILVRTYDGVVDGDFLNPLTGKSAWCGDSRDFWERYSIDLSKHAGRSVRIRFRFGTDNSIARVGWHVDSVEIKGCFDLFSDRFE